MPSEYTLPIAQKIAQELNLSLRSVTAVMELLDEGNTIPFVARYRKEATGDLDEVAIRSIQERMGYLRELFQRKEAILESIESQGKLTEELKKKIEESETKAAVEDLYLPYKPKRRTKAMIAREKGLEPLAEEILSQPLTGSPSESATHYIDEEKGVSDSDEALQGARHIVAEIASERAEIRGWIREHFAQEGVVASQVEEEKKEQPSKFEQYYSFTEPVKTIPSHRYLAIRRGENEGFLNFSIEVEAEICTKKMHEIMGLKLASPFRKELEMAIEDSYKRLIRSSVETDIRVELKMRSDGEAVDVFASNLHHLLMAAPLGGKPVFGIDPGLRTGCKLAVVDHTGKFLENTTLHLTQGSQSKQKGQAELLACLQRHQPFAIAVGNGTGNREAEAFVKETLQLAGISEILVIQVNEAGASVYSASDVAREEFPELDLTVRGAISIARRLQDPLSELVKIDPKSIGVGQYQHDVYQPMLQEKLQSVVESCVNAVGVELNTASASLLSYVSGVGGSIAQKILSYRNSNGAFKSREELLKVPGLGPKTYEQAAGFLRIREGTNPLDRSAVHPERYSVVESMVQELGVPLQEVIGNSKLVDSIDVSKYESASIGAYTLRDIAEELRKPGRDPRASFEPPAFREDIQTIQDLHPGLKLEGVVTNVTAFGAFVDIGVHQDGLVHVSQISDKFVKDPSEVVSAGDRIQVKVLEVDAGRKRISLSAKKDGALPPSGGKGKKTAHKAKKRESFQTSPFANL